MAAERIEKMQEDEVCHTSDLEMYPEHGANHLKRQARVTVKYNRKELQKRLDVEKWIDDSLDQLYFGKEDSIPEVNIDDLIDLPTDEERVKRLQELLEKCSNNTEEFIVELVGKLNGLHKQEELQSEGIEHPVINTHAQHRHEPYHFNNPQSMRIHNQTL